jgi:hypothetical protein
VARGQAAVLYDADTVLGSARSVPVIVAEAAAPA